MKNKYGARTARPFLKTYVLFQLQHGKVCPHSRIGISFVFLKWFVMFSIYFVKCLLFVHYYFSLHEHLNVYTPYLLYLFIFSTFGFSSFFRILLLLMTAFTPCLCKNVSNLVWSFAVECKSCPYMPSLSGLLNFLSLLYFVTIFSTIGALYLLYIAI